MEDEPMPDEPIIVNILAMMFAVTVIAIVLSIAFTIWPNLLIP